MAKKVINKKRFSSKVMEYELQGNVSRGMYLCIKKHCRENESSFASYLRELIMHDLKIDELGNQTTLK